MTIAKNKVLSFDYIYKFIKDKKLDYFPEIYIVRILVELRDELINTRKALETCCSSIYKFKITDNLRSTVHNASEILGLKNKLYSMVDITKCLEYKYKHKQMNLLLECNCGHKFKFRVQMKKEIYNNVIKIAIKEKLEI